MDRSLSFMICFDMTWGTESVSSETLSVTSFVTLCFITLSRGEHGLRKTDMVSEAYKRRNSQVGKSP